jgi:isoaspartyl peptidase/L-asparaginase-like protein (Ntn-hydrolase superfamily)
VRKGLIAAVIALAFATIAPHVMMTGKGAELFATKIGLEIVDPS